MESARAWLSSRAGYSAQKRKSPGERIRSPGLLRSEASVGVEPTMSDLQSDALATWLRRLGRQRGHRPSGTGSAFASTRPDSPERLPTKGRSDAVVRVVSAGPPPHWSRNYETGGRWSRCDGCRGVGSRRSAVGSKGPSAPPTLKSCPLRTADCPLDRFYRS